jgi:hypothetical protein
MSQQLLADHVFRQRQNQGLALFLAPHIFREYRVPVALDEWVVVTHRFHIKPLLPLLSGNGHFFVLALSQKEVRLLQGTRYSISEVELQGVPQGITEALRFEDVEKGATTTQARKVDRPEGSRHSRGMGWVLRTPPMNHKTLFSGISSRLTQGYARSWATSVPPWCSRELNTCCPCITGRTPILTCWRGGHWESRRAASGRTPGTRLGHRPA